VSAIIILKWYIYTIQASGSARICCDASDPKVPVGRSALSGLAAGHRGGDATSIASQSGRSLVRAVPGVSHDIVVDEQTLETTEDQPDYSECSTGSSVVTPFHPNSFETAVVVSIRVGRNARSRRISATSRKAVMDIAPTTRFE
jgi:hypothetical protein